MSRTKAGFTIVELLIVIVVIGILAAITIVAYNGIQNRAENAKTIAAVDTYKKGVIQYGVDKGSYPNGAWCLGDQYPLLGGGTSGCRQTTSPVANTYGAGIRDTFKPYMGNVVPMPSTKILYNTAGTVGYSGGLFYGMDYVFTLNSSPVVAILYYINDVTCPVGPAYSTTGWPNFTGSPVSRSEVLSSTASTCLILLTANP